MVQPVSAPVRHTAAPMREHAHGHDHAHHDHSHHAHSRAHDRAEPATPRRSLMALSGIQRLAMVLPLIAALWLLTYWAMYHG